MAQGFPVTLCLANRPCLVVGGGRVATRKVRSLLDAGARVRVVAPDVEEELRELAARGVIAYEARPVSLDDLGGAFLVVSAADDPAANELIGRAALAAGLLVNVVDQPALCNFFVPATVHRGSLSVAVSTSGSSPLLARRLREKLENVVGPEYGALAELLGRVRQEFTVRCPDAATRAHAWDTLGLAPILALLGADQAEAAAALVQAHLEEACMEAPKEEGSCTPRPGCGD
jgi:precorrin-2 dehydrogenase/sirohydrochlorin ferrochelatase